MAFATTWMQMEILMLNEVSQKENDKYHINYMWNLKYGVSESVYKIEMDSQTQRTVLWLLRGKDGRWTMNLASVDANYYILNG